MKNAIIEYRGGGYDGCFWEYNYCYFDQDGEFIDIFSSGREGCPTLADLQQAAREGRTLTVWRLEDEIDRFADLRCLYVTIALAKKLDELAGLECYATCPECSRQQPAAEFQVTGYRGDGGIGVIGTHWACEECYSLGTCVNCGEYHGPEELDPDGFCEYCSRWHYDLDMEADLIALARECCETVPLIRERHEAGRSAERFKKMLPAYEELLGEAEAALALEALQRAYLDYDDKIKAAFFGV